ncbi:MAG: polysulfide reductase NrfD [SAR324 cluster bacterium]|nr:polysulfide reductase NrfD [SAR324 cluster bacterium]
MTEFITNKVNPAVLPHLEIWGSDVAIYLFLGGLSGGLLVISAAMVLLQNGGIFNKNRPRENYSGMVQVASLLAPVLLGIGMLFLFLDLEFKLHVWRFYTNFNITSPMSWGSWLLILFFPFSALQALVVFKNYYQRAPKFQQLAAVMESQLDKIAFINVHVGLAIGVYTGILLSTFYARPLWSSPALGFLFLFSGLSSAAALLLLFAPREEKTFFSKMDMYLIALEGFAATLFILGGMTGIETAKEAMLLLLVGPYAPWFWVLFVLGGLIVPLLLETFEAIGKIKFTPLVPLLILVGGLSLRFIIVFAGQSVPTFS